MLRDYENPGLSLVDQKRCHAVEEHSQRRVCLIWQGRFVECGSHELDPPVSGILVHYEWRVSHPQPWVATLCDVVLRAAESEDQESSKSSFRTGKIVCWIHGAENAVIRHLAIERGHQSAEAVFSYTVVDLTFGQWRHVDYSVLDSICVVGGHLKPIRSIGFWAVSVEER